MLQILLVLTHNNPINPNPITMPNWCSNDLTISGDNTSIKQFVDDHQLNTHEDWGSDDGLFSMKVPLPDTENWYEWSCDNWGTKWDVAEFLYMDIDEDTITLQFETAWSPPIKWLKSVGKLYPTLKFEMNFEEPGCDFIGDIVVEGDDHFENYYSYSMKKWAENDGDEYLNQCVEVFKDRDPEDEKLDDEIREWCCDNGVDEIDYMMVEKVIEALKGEESETSDDD